MQNEEWEPNSEAGMQDQFWEMREKSVLTDVTFLIGPKHEKVEAHKLVLARASSVLHAMLFGPMAEKGEIKLEDTDTTIFLKFLKFVYCDKVDLQSCIHAIELCYMGHKYMISKLCQLCVDFLCKNISTQFFWQAWNLGNLVENKQLQDMCMKVLKLRTIEILNSENFHEISKDKLKLILEQDYLNINKDEMILITAVLNWGSPLLGDINKNTREKLGPDIIKLIRFLTITPQQFASKFTHSDFLTDTEKITIFSNLCGTDLPLPDTISICKTIRKIDNLVKLKQLEYKLHDNDELSLYIQTVKNTDKIKCIYIFTAPQAFWLHGVEMYTSRTSRKRKANVDPTFDDFYYEDITFTVTKINTSENSDLQTCETLILTEYKKRSLQNSTNKILFKSPLFIHPEVKYEIKAVLKYKGNYNSECSCIVSYEGGNCLKDFTINPVFQSNARLFKSLIFFAFPKNSLSADCNDVKNKSEKPM